MIACDWVTTDKDGWFTRTPADHFFPPKCHHLFCEQFPVAALQMVLGEATLRTSGYTLTCLLGTLQAQNLSRWPGRGCGSTWSIKALEHFWSRASETQFHNIGKLKTKTKQRMQMASSMLNWQNDLLSFASTFNLNPTWNASGCKHTFSCKKMINVDSTECFYMLEGAAISFRAWSIAKGI